MAHELHILPERLQILMCSIPRTWIRLLVSGRQPITAGEWAINSGTVRGLRACAAGLLVRTTTDADRLGSTVMLAIWSYFLCVLLCY